MENKVSYIYKVTNLVNGKVYIGQSIDPIKRINQHTRYSANGSYLLHYAIQKYGVENFLFEIIRSEIPIEQADETEIKCIKEHDCKVPLGYNLTDGGGGCVGYIVSEETKLKMSAAAKNRCSNRIGYSHSETTKEKMRKPHKYYDTSSRIGKKRGKYKPHSKPAKSEETKRRISESCKKAYLEKKNKENDTLLNS